VKGIPYIYYHGTEADFNILVMDMLEPSLSDLFAFCGNRFSLKTTLMLADQILPEWTPCTRRISYTET
jgi:hypothetical protein